MELDMDCIRDILLEVEGKSTFAMGVRFPEGFSSELLRKYPERGKLQYHIRQCYLAGMLIPASDGMWDVGGKTTIKDLSPKGHTFLANIRKENTWARVKTIAKKVGSFSLDAFASIASGLVSDAIQAHFVPKG